MGSTHEGASWALKALHPAEEMVGLRGIPDADAFPSVCMDYETVVTINPPATIVAGETWRADVNLFAHPVQPLSFIVSNTAGTKTGYGGAVNPTLAAGVDYDVYSRAFGSLCHSYRMLYTGATIDLDASGLSDNGSVVAAQMPRAYHTYNVSTLNTAPPPYYTSFQHVVWSGFPQNFPGAAISQLPGCFMGLAKDGCYMPLKIDPHAEWAMSEDFEFISDAASNTGTLRRCDLNTTISGGAPGQCFPFYGDAVSAPVVAPVIATGPDRSHITGTLCVPFQQINFGFMRFYNLNSAASLTVKVRWGVEMRVPPTSVLAPALQPSCSMDALALAAYSDMAGKLPWAYPSSYNGWDELLPVLKSVWNGIKGSLGVAAGMIPVIGPAARAAVEAIPRFERPPGNGDKRAGGFTMAPRIKLATPRRGLRVGQRAKKASSPPNPSAAKRR